MLGSQGRPESIEISVEVHGGIRGRCSRCRRPAPGYDRLPQRRWLFVPLWGIPTYFCYAPRRVQCAEHGVVVEHIPWSDGKRPVTCARMGFLARWARRLSWRETAQAFQTSWEAVYRSVEWFVEWGLAHRELRDVTAIGVDEIHWGHGLRADNFLTVIYQIDAPCRRLLWVGKRRSQATLRRGLKALGPEVIKGLRFVCSDMEALPASHRRSSRPSLARAGSFPHHQPSESGGRSGAPNGEHTPAGQKQQSRAAAQAYALALTPPREPGTRAGSAKAECSAGLQVGDRTGLGIEGGLLPLLEIQNRTLGRRLS